MGGHFLGSGEHKMKIFIENFSSNYKSYRIVPTKFES